MNGRALTHYSAMAREATALAYQGQAKRIAIAAVRDLSTAVAESSLAKPVGCVIDGVEYVLPELVRDEMHSVAGTLESQFGLIVRA